jgi:uncharacterized protein (DUF1015 family)
MAKIFPFRAIRAPRDKVGLVASRSYINYSKSDLISRLKGNPYTFLHVLNPDNSVGNNAPRSRNARFLNIKDKLHAFIDDGHLFKEEDPAIYIYRQEAADFAFFGLICGISIDDYLSGNIKIHENTLTRKERLFKQYLDCTRFNAEPVLLTHKPIRSVNSLINKYSKRFPDYDFRTTDTVRHQLWVIRAKTDILAIQKAYDGLDSLYLADGHHRSASSALLAKSDRRKKVPGIGSEMFMVLNVPEDQLRILAFDRLVKDLNGLTKEDFLERLEEHFKIKQVKKKKGFRPKKVHRFGIYIEGKWYRIILRKKFRDFKSPVESLDVQILTKFILEPLLGIVDQKNDRRISFSGGYEDVSQIENLVNKKKFKIGISLFPVSTEQLKDIADASQVMPPKSTWIEPKLRSGLTIMDLDDTNAY